MNRGYLKFWRKAQDSASWNRGLIYRGLMIDFLTRAGWKNSSYQGKAMLPGQFGAVMSYLAEGLGVPRSTLQRMVAHLEADDFLKVENVGNRFVVITIVNWRSYQESERDERATDGQPTVNQRATDGQPSYKVEEVKKEEGKNINTPPIAPHGGESGDGEPESASPPPPKSTRPQSGNSVPELRRAIDAYAASPPLRRALEDFRIMRERIRKPMTGRALDLILINLDKLAGGDDALKIAILEQSVVNSWQGVFALKGAGLARASPGGVADADDISRRNAETAAAVLADRRQRRQEQHESAS